MIQARLACGLFVLKDDLKLLKEWINAITEKQELPCVFCVIVIILSIIGFLKLFAL